MDRSDWRVASYRTRGTSESRLLAGGTYELAVCRDWFVCHHRDLPRD